MRFLIDCVLSWGARGARGASIEDQRAEADEPLARILFPPPHVPHCASLVDHIISYQIVAGNVASKVTSYTSEVVRNQAARLSI